jgi:uncharacterized paraquat-inducible protein A
VTYPGLDIIFLFLLTAGIVLLMGLWIYYERRDGQRESEGRQDVIYHCIKCSQIYTGVRGSEECDCPKCGFCNGRLQF